MTIYQPTRALESDNIFYEAALRFNLRLSGRSMLIQVLNLLMQIVVICAVVIAPLANASANSNASTARRVVLVIGNDAYQATTPLERAVADARAMAAEFRAMGFEVLERTNLDRRGMNRALIELTDRVQGGDVAAVFFAGHGVQVQGSNYLLPIDVKVSRADELPDEAIDLARVMDRLAQTKAQFSLLIIDACRDNPFPKTGGRSIGAPRGLAMPQAPQGLVVVYSAGLNEQAVDRLGPADVDPNGLFTREFLKVLREPGVTVDAMVRRVRARVSEIARQAGFQQNPAIYDQAIGEFFFRPPVRTNHGAQTAAMGENASLSEATALELALWDSVRNTTMPGELQEYLRQFPNGRFSVLARSRLDAVTTASADSIGVHPGRPIATLPWAQAPSPEGKPQLFFGDDGNYLMEVEVVGSTLRLNRFVVRRPGGVLNFRCGVLENTIPLRQSLTLDSRCQAHSGVDVTGVSTRIIKGSWPMIEITGDRVGNSLAVPIPDGRLLLTPGALRADFEAAKKRDSQLTTERFARGRAE